MTTVVRRPYSDPDEGDRLRDEAIALVTAAADPGWKQQAFEAGVRAAEANWGNAITTDEVWIELGWYPDAEADRRAISHVMRRLVQEKYIRPLENRFRKSVLPQCHRRLKKMYVCRGL